MGDDSDPSLGSGGPHSQRAPQGPLSSRASRLAPPKSDSEVPPSAGSFDGEDFLYHLYRGSELLQDNCVPQAKEELERALKLQPQDTEGQGLLGVVYFRLGLYPRAIGIYEEIIKQGRTAFLSAPLVAMVEGGVPIVVDGEVIGSIGVSGVKSEQDAAIARAGIAALGLTG